MNGKPLIFIDEIQTCERAITSLKYFCEQMPEAYHHVALEWYQKYFIVGGMPAVVNQKYADPTTGIKIRACFNSIPAQLAKENAKFQYKVVQRGGTLYG